MFRKLEQDNLIPLAKDKNANFPKIEIELTRIQTALDQTSLQWLRRCFFMLNRDNYVCSTTPRPMVIGQGGGIPVVRYSMI